MKSKNLFLTFPLVLLIITLWSCSTQDKKTADFANYKYFHEPVVKPAFVPLPYGSIEAKGWLREWTIATKEGLVGNNTAFDKAWADSMPPNFLGEQTAYWIDGMLCTGYILHDSELINKAQNDIKSFLKNRKYTSSWGMAVYGRAIMAYYKGTGDTSVLRAMTDLYKDAELTGFWEITKMFGNLKPVFGEGVTADISEITKNEPRNLIQVEAMIDAFSYGADSVLLKKSLEGMKKIDTRFTNHFLGRNRETCFNNNGCLLSMHGVSYNEFAKIWAFAYLYNNNIDYLQTSINAYKEIDDNNMMPYGVNSSHENLMGVDAIGSSETCDIIDFIHSNTLMYRIVGNSSYGDKIERALFNAGATSYSHDCKKHVYFQSPNKRTFDQSLKHKGHHEYKPIHDPLCCTGNMGRMIPNYILHMWMATPNNGVAALMYGPSKVSVKVANGVPVEIVESTSYPFDETISMMIKTPQSVHFPLSLRIPKWCKSPSIKVLGQSIDIKINENGFVVITREWKDKDQVVINLPMEVKCVSGITKSNGAKSSVDISEVLTPGLPYSFIERGPLLYTLKLDDKNSNYRFAIDTTQKEFEVKEGALLDAFSWANIPLSITFKAQPIDWKECPKLEKQAIPKSNKTESITLVPYGCSQGLRITMFPVVK